MRRKNGFTIIEVSLVIAVAGLIFLMVFVALPGLRASQKDTNRREAMTAFTNAVQKYQENNRGALPGTTDSLPNSVSNDNIPQGAAETSWAGFYRDYLGDSFRDPDGVNYRLNIIECGASVADADCNGSLEDAFFPNDYEMTVVVHGACKGGKAIRSNNPRKLAVLYVLESGGVYCSNS